MTVEEFFERNDDEDLLTDYSESSSEEEEESQEEIETAPNVLPPRTNNSPLEQEQPPTKKRKLQETMNRMNEFLHVASENMAYSLQSQHPDLYHLANFWAHRLLTLNPTERTTVEKQITELLFNATMKNEDSEFEEVRIYIDSSFSPDTSPPSSVKRLISPVAVRPKPESFNE